MEKNTETEQTQEQKGNRPKKRLGFLIGTINKSMFLLNVLAALFVLYQIADFFTDYSHKDSQLFEQGRIVSINAHNNEVSLKDITKEEIEKRKQAAKEQKEFVAGHDKKENEKEFEKAVKENQDKESEKENEQTASSDKTPDDKTIDPEKIDGKDGKVTAENKPVDYTTANLGIIVTDVGLKMASLTEAESLPKEVTFAFSPYADQVDKKVGVALSDGRQVLMNLMMQSPDFPIRDNGPLAIQENYEESINLTRLQRTLELATGYVGVLASEHEIITSKNSKIAPILKDLSSRNLAFGFFKTAYNSVLEDDAKPLAADVFTVDFLVDEILDEQEIINRLNIVKEELLLKQRKIVIAIRPYPISIQTLNKWLEENRGENIQIAPISYFVTNN